ncbi:DUF659 domain-containing protein [Aphis craccivora]|uniref:DUF659 domain-containing protein n=1 Tax=Aphis craccivora TaxID=307492 RepID=A0A6G0VXD7_APHCR|nr:DUF659 domain-containing protein [Aphis craccivora]
MKQALLSVPNKPESNFYEDLCTSMIAANIPWYKLQHIPDESTLRKNYLQPCYIQAIEHIRKSLEDSFIWIVVDETTDINGHYVANLLVGALNCDKLSRSFSGQVGTALLAFLIK